MKTNYWEDRAIACADRAEKYLAEANEYLRREKIDEEYLLIRDDIEKAEDDK